MLQALGDRIGVGCTLERGEYNRAWNTVLLFDDDENVSLPVLCTIKKVNLSMRMT